MTFSLAEAYGNKDTAYFGGARRDIVEDFPTGRDLRVLEIGCGTGGTGALAKSTGRAAYYVGIELDPSAAQQARTVLDEVVVANVETLDIPFAPASFDGLVMSEVLEHLIDPWSTVKKLAPLLKPGGFFYASSPNVASLSILRMLLKNRWDYVDSGRMDWTHLRWFTPKTYSEMVEAAGFKVVWLKPVAKLTAKQKLVDTLTLGLFAHLFVGQIFIKAERL